MKKHHRRHAFAAASVAIVALAGVPAAAQQFPSRPMEMIIPFAAGGPTDIVGRVLGGKMSELLGQTVVVEDRGGAGGTIGAAAVAKASP